MKLRKNTVVTPDHDRITIAEYSGEKPELTGMSYEDGRLIIVVGESVADFEIRVLPCVYDHITLKRPRAAKGAE